MQTNSIPLQLERGVSLKEIGAAIKVCLLTGDEVHGTSSVVHRLGSAIYGAHLEEFSISSPRFVYDALSFTSKSGTPGGVWTEASQDVYLRDGITLSPLKLVINADYGDLTKQEATGLSFKTINGIDSDLFLADGMPFVKYESIVVDSGYDEFGNYDKDELVMKGLSIALPKTYGDAVPFYNGSRKLSLTVNMVEYVECLQARIQPGSGE